MAKKHDNRGRSVGEGPFFQMQEWLMRSAAWRATSPYERALYLELKRRYNGRNNGNIPLSHREAEQLLNCSNTPVEKAFKGLQAKGFIKPQQRGSFDWKTVAKGQRCRATRWILTEFPVDHPVHSLGPGTKEFMGWAPENELRSDESGPLVRRDRTKKAGVAR